MAWLLSTAADTRPKATDLVAKKDEPTCLVKLNDLQQLRSRLRPGRASRKGRGRTDDFKVSPASLRGLGKTEVSIRLWSSTSFATTAGTDYTQSVAMNPSATGEFASLAALYDECIVDGGVFHYSFVPRVAGTTGSVNPNVVCYDPMNAAGLGSVVNGLQHEQHQLTMWAQLPAILNPIGVPALVNEMGFHSFAWTVPRNNARSNTSASVFGHEWSDTADVSDVYGQIKPYFTAPPGGGVSVQLWYFIWSLSCRFRCRS